MLVFSELEYLLSKSDVFVSAEESLVAFGIESLLKQAGDKRQPIAMFAVSAGLDLGVLNRQIKECLTMGCIAHIIIALLFFVI